MSPVTILAVLDLSLVLVLVVVILVQNRERALWADERRGLINRVVGRHAGEVVALDREAKRDRPDRPDTSADARYVEGLT